MALALDDLFARGWNINSTQIFGGKRGGTLNSTHFLAGREVEH